MCKCLVCNSECEFNNLGALNMNIDISCPVCGDYIITDIAADELQSNEKYRNNASKISAYLQHRKILQLPKVHIFYDKEKAEDNTIVVSIDEIINSFPRDINDRINKILLNLSKLSKFTGDYIIITESSYPIFFTDSINIESILFIIKYLNDIDLLEFKYPHRISTMNFPMGVRLTVKGWDRVIQFGNSNNISLKQAFVAMWFDKALNDVYKNGIEKAVIEAGYTPMRIDMKEHNNKICDEIILEIKRSKFIICDFTGQRPGVYFEAGFTMGLGRQVIWLCKKDEIDEVHFDTRQYNHIVWENEDDLYRKLLTRIKLTIA